MTVAICLLCGIQKFGAWTPCKECAFVPASVSAMSQALFLSDHTMKIEGLTRFAERIKNHLPWYIDDKMANQVMPGFGEVYDNGERTEFDPMKEPGVSHSIALRLKYYLVLYDEQVHQASIEGGVTSAQSLFEQFQRNDSRLYPLEFRVYKSGALVGRLLKRSAVPDPAYMVTYPPFSSLNNR